jgi:hypothetical protein
LVSQAVDTLARSSLAPTTREDPVGRPRAGSTRTLITTARRQRGLFTLRQALACGYTADYAERRVRDRTWTEIEPLVYCVTLAAARTWQQRLLALVLATGGAAGDRSAAALFGLLPPPAAAEVVIDHRSRTARHHRADVRALRGWAERDLVTVDGIRCLSVARTLIELGSCLGDDQLTDVVDTAILRGLVTPRRLARRATELWAPRRRGCAVVLRALESAHPELWRTRNDWEARVLRALRRVGAPEPQPNFPVFVGGQRRFIDFAWPAAKVALEFDGFVPHSNRRTFDDDRVRQNDLVDDEWRVYRITATALRRSAGAALAPVLRAIGA